MTVANNQSDHNIFYNRKRRFRSIAIALTLGALVVLFYAVTIGNFDISVGN